MYNYVISLHTQYIQSELLCRVQLTYFHLKSNTFLPLHTLSIQNCKVCIVNTYWSGESAV